MKKIGPEKKLLTKEDHPHNWQDIDLFRKKLTLGYPTTNRHPTLRTPQCSHTVWGKMPKAH